MTRGQDSLLLITRVSIFSNIHQPRLDLVAYKYAFEASRSSEYINFNHVEQRRRRASAVPKHSPSYAISRRKRFIRASGSSSGLSNARSIDAGPRATSRARANTSTRYSCKEPRVGAALGWHSDVQRFFRNILDVGLPQSTHHVSSTNLSCSPSGIFTSCCSRIGAAFSFDVRLLRPKSIPRSLPSADSELHLSYTSTTSSLRCCWNSPHRPSDECIDASATCS